MDAILNQLFFQQPFILLYAVVVGVSIWKFPKYYDSPLRFLPVLLMYTLLTEIAGAVLRDDEAYSLLLKEFYFNNNWLIYNIYNFVFFAYILYVYHAYFRSARWRKLAGWGAALFFLTSVVNAFLQDFFTVSQLYAYGLGGLLMIVFSGKYLAQEYPRRREVPFWRNLLVWISGGIFVFYLGYLPVKYLRYGIAYQLLDPIPYITEVHTTLIMLMYGAFLAGFLLMARMRKVV